ncbi:MAG TPA: Maf family protein [Gemmatimonadales bacterium]|nr:Maf family protein [Gemmatimonadales bacterium]
MTRVLTLASASPRRKQLLEMLGLPIRVVPSHIPEAPLPRETPLAYSKRLAREKSRAVPGEFVLGADTIVVMDEHLLEKPADVEDAVRMLTLLQGRSHEVISSVALAHNGKEEVRTDITKVTFRECDEAMLRAYVATGEPMDKAGAYGIQGYGAALVEKVEGDFFGVMGLPVRLVLELLTDAGWGYRFGR